MGVVIKKLAKAVFEKNANEYLEFELNKSNKILIQNKALRIEMKLHLDHFYLLKIN